ncbi:alpha/beta fold hydrolase [Acinetobacter sp. A3.8]|uniref:Alpha/beta fold hydrolase n=1 Tax=Acinetobacter sedimenti TaxID=2919922 RepID=A0A9X1WZG7_9GAMM|nr:YqiA/YcfP family alpha/beta fold hydrolase [Acinetobacter sedimenti]MCJ8146907.1 alpha/beta fold hydrolase [Acinetobacter sedimenti]
MSEKILFIHGFASVGHGVKSLQLKQWFGNDVFAPDLNHRPLTDLNDLSALIKKEQITTIVGSSLGGFYGLLLAMQFPVKLVLINPALQSPHTLQKYIGTVARYNGEQFTWSQQQVDELSSLLKQFAISKDQQLDQSKILILLSKQDEVLDYQIAIDTLPNANIIVDEFEDHRFADIGKYRQQIETFIKR